MPLLLLTYLLPEVYNELKAECEPTVVETMEFKALTEKLTELYEPDKGEYSARFVFRGRKQKPTESIQDYLLALKKLSTPCKSSSAELSSQLKDQLIAGVSSKLVRYELFKESGKTMSIKISFFCALDTHL